GDAHRHRVGANSHQLPINQAKAPVNNYQKDGNMRFNNGNSEINYEPNSYTETPKEDPKAKISSFEVEGNVGNYSYNQD
ncbi:catalase, partial [Salmonella enterica]|nr:catalase [Salmonella enterica]